MLCASLFVACEKGIKNVEPLKSEVSANFNDYDVQVENGYLSFSSQSALDNYLVDLEKALDNNTTTRSISCLPVVDGFISLEGSKSL